MIPFTASKLIVHLLGNVLRLVAVTLHENSEKQSFQELATSRVIRIFKILKKAPNFCTKEFTNRYVKPS